MGIYTTNSTREWYFYTKMSVPITAEEKTNKKNDVKARSLPPEWNTHVVVWMNKADIETISIDDLYNNFKIVEQDVKKSVSASSGAQNLAFLTTPSTSSTNDVNTANLAYEVGSRLAFFVWVIHSEDLKLKFLRSLPIE
ncbi:hypothetical protein Tco_0932898 [Tanacetum coccineum]